MSAGETWVVPASGSGGVGLVLVVGCCMHEGLVRLVWFSPWRCCHTTWFVLILFGGHDEGERARARERVRGGERGGRPMRVLSIESSSLVRSFVRSLRRSRLPF